MQGSLVMLPLLGFTFTKLTTGLVVFEGET